MPHKIIIMREKDERSGGSDAARAERHREVLEAAAWQMGAIAPRFFKAVKARVAQNVELPEDVREMGESQLRVLHTLGLGRHRASDLARQFNVTNPTISRIIDSLVDKGYVQRFYDAHDRRCIYLELTGQGQQAENLMHGHFHEAMMEFLDPLTDEQLEDIVKAFKHLESLVPEIHFEAEGETPARTEGGRYGAYHGARAAARHAADRVAHHVVRGAQREIRRQLRDMQKEVRRQTNGE